MAKQSKREQQRDAMVEAIKAIARQQMIADGTASVSLRGIARELDVTAPALYRYFADRNDLITDLLLDAYNGLADALIEAGATPPRDQYAERMIGMANAYRDWAIAYPTDYQLIFGNPIPGYVAPSEKTTAAATRSFDPLVSVLGDALVGGVLIVPSPLEALPEPMNAHMAALAAYEEYPYPPVTVYLALSCWTRLHGVVSLELFDNIQPIVGDAEGFFRSEIQRLCAELGLLPKV